MGIMEMVNGSPAGAMKAAMKRVETGKRDGARREAARGEAAPGKGSEGGLDPGKGGGGRGLENVAVGRGGEVGREGGAGLGIEDSTTGGEEGTTGEGRENRTGGVLIEIGETDLEIVAWRRGLGLHLEREGLVAPSLPRGDRTASFTSGM